jgi:mono/diheme cytochrome c family protein
MKRMRMILAVAGSASVLAASLAAGLNVSSIRKQLDRVDSWRAPASAASKSNPIPVTAASVRAGRSLFSTNCEACHGSNGTGDGPTGAFLSPHPANLTTASFWSQGEGAIFWKITHGHSPMPSFRDALSRKQRWEVIDYLKKQFDKH